MSKIKKISTEEIKKEANDYYKDKNLHVRYIILFVILLVFWLRFLMPIVNIGNINTENEIFELDLNGFKFANKTVYEKNNISSSEKDLFLSSLSEISQNQIDLVFARDKWVWVELKSYLEKYWVNSDLYYLAIALSDLENLDNIATKWIRKMDEKTANNYWLIVDEFVDQRLDLETQTMAFSLLLENLYSKYKDRNLVIISLDIWEEKLDEIITKQNKIDYDELYFSNWELWLLNKVYSWKYIFENSPLFLSKNLNLDLSDDFVVKKETVRSISNIQERVSDKNSNISDFMQLNPWILSGSLQRWSRTVLYSETN